VVSRLALSLDTTASPKVYTFCGIPFLIELREDLIENLTALTPFVLLSYLIEIFPKSGVMI